MNNQINQVIQTTLTHESEYISDIPTIRDLYKYSKIRLRKKRLRKKFAKQPRRYVPEKVYFEFIRKMLTLPIRRTMCYSAIGRKLFTVEPLPNPMLDTSCHRNSTMSFT